MQNDTDIFSLECTLSAFFGLKGEFAVLSGSALLLQMANNRKILALPPEIDFKGTMIMVRIPAEVPDGFNLYDYMS